MQWPPRDGKRSARKLSRSFGSSAAALGVAGAVPSPLSGPVLLMAALMGALGWTADALAKDPPRDDWRVATSVESRELRFDLLPIGAEGIRRICEVLDEADTCLRAGLVAFERAQGAQLAQGVIGSTALRDRLSESTAFFAQARVALRDGSLYIELEFSGTPAPSRVRRVPDSLRDYPDESLAFIRDVGMDTSEIGNLAHLHRRGSFIRFNVDSRLRATAEEMRSFSEVLREWPPEPTQG